MKDRPLIAGGAVYLVALAAVVANTALSFRGFYSAPVPPGEDQVLRMYQEYRQFLHLVGLALAVYLGVWAAAVGWWRGRVMAGLAALAGGALVTILALAPLPWIRFPNDQYAVGAAWLFDNVVPLTLSWVLATPLARLILGPPRTTASPPAPAPA